MTKNNISLFIGGFLVGMGIFDIFVPPFTAQDAVIVFVGAILIFISWK